MTYKLRFTKQAKKDWAKIERVPALYKRAKSLLELLVKDPFETPPPCEKLTGDLKVFYSRRINIQHRLVYEVSKKERAVKIARMGTHYE